MPCSSWLICLSQNYGSLITSGAILITAGIAVLAIYRNSNIAKKRATVDLVMHQKQDTEFVAAKKKLHELHDKKVQFSKYALSENSKTEENESILCVLNEYEFVAVGIREGAFDEGTYK